MSWRLKADLQVWTQQILRRCFSERSSPTWNRAPEPECGPQRGQMTGAAYIVLVYP